VVNNANYKELEKERMVDVIIFQHSGEFCIVQYAFLHFPANLIPNANVLKIKELHVPVRH
jgi:hypothetical protein